MRQISTSTLTGWENLEALAGPWEELQLDSGASNVFMTWEWVSSWWRAFGAEARLVLVAATEGDRLVGIAPLYRRKADDGAGGVPLMLLGSGESVSPDHLSFILRRGYEEPAARALTAAALDLAGAGRLDLTDVPHDGPLARWLARSRADGVCWAAHDWAVCPYVALPDSWEAYESGLSRNLRYNLRRRTRQLMRDLGGELLTWHTERESEAGLEHVARLHRLRWEGRAERFSFSDPGYLAFHRDFAQRAARRGWLRLYGLRVDGQVIGAWYGFRRGDVLCYYQSGFDPAWEKRSPGMVLQGLVIRDAIRDGARELDLLKGDYEFKRAWATGSRRTLRIMVARRGLRGCAAVAPAWLESHKQHLKRLLAGTAWPRRRPRWAKGPRADAPAAR